MKKYIVMARETWSHLVEANSAEEAKQLVEDGESRGRSDLYEIEAFDVEEADEEEKLCHPTCVCGWCETGKWMKEDINGEV